MLSGELFKDFINSMEKTPPRSIYIAEVGCAGSREPRTYHPLFPDSLNGKTRAWAIAYNHNTAVVGVKGSVNPEAVQFTVEKLKFGQRYLAKREVPDMSYAGGHQTRIPIIMDVKYHGINDAAALDY